MTDQWWLGFTAGVASAGIVALLIYLYFLWRRMPNYTEQLYEQ